MIENSDTRENLAAAIHEWLGQIMRVSMHGFIRYAKESGLSMSQTGALFKIHRQKICGVGGVGEELGITSAAASQMIDRLVQQELLQRVEDPKDRRGKVLSLTPKGEAVVREAASARQSWIARLVDTLNEEERARVAQTLSLLSQKAKDLEEGGK
jgi:DNA-binding MarR family transcriptional regulator